MQISKKRNEIEIKKILNCKKYTLENVRAHDALNKQLLLYFTMAFTHIKSNRIFN